MLYWDRQEKCALMKGTVAVDIAAIFSLINDRPPVAEHAIAPYGTNMAMAERHKLADSEVACIKTWIDQGAK